MDFFQTNPALGAAFIALTGVVISALVAFVGSRRSIYISSVTAERSKWIDKLRTNIADLLGVCSALHHAKIHKKTDESPALKQDADRLIALISLQLNPTDESGIDRNLIIHMEELIKVTGVPITYRTEEEKFIRHCQFLLKEEWEKVKSEAKGVVRQYLSGERRARERRKREYRDFYLAKLKLKRT